MTIENEKLHTGTAPPTIESVAVDKEKGVMTFSIGNASFKMVKIPAGSFIMGSSQEERGHHKERQHKVTLTRDYWVGETEVTVALWRQFVHETGYRSDAEKGGGASIWIGYTWKKTSDAYWDNPYLPWDNPSIRQEDDQPVTCVSWHDTKAFIKWLSRRTGYVFRLPTEAEWEYAARAGTTTAFHCGELLLDRAGWYCGNARGTTRPVAQKTPNTWGLFDMHGNVKEWCQDSEGDYPSGSVTDPDGGPTTKYNFRILRGGSWFEHPTGCRSACRYSFPADMKNNDYGFRLAGSF